jgi:hypothetical protein
VPSGQAHEFSLPANLQVILAVIGIASFVLTFVGVVLTVQLSPRKSNEAPQTGRSLHPIRFWRPSQYALALGHLYRFQERLSQDTYSKGMNRGFVTESDLVRWITQLALTCASQMVPQSLGKANLFRVSQIESNSRGHTTAISLYSSEFVGVFSVNQLTNWMNPTELRSLSSTEGQHVSGFPGALQCCVDGLPMLQSLRQRGASFDEPEKALGATHILAIPLFSSIHSVREEDQAVSITVDLRYSWLGGLILDHRNLQKTSLFRRATQLKALLADIPQLQDPRFLPLSDRVKLAQKYDGLKDDLKTQADHPT